MTRYVIAWLIFVLAGCKKETVSMLVQQTNSDNGYNILAIQFLNDTIGFATGGTRYTTGVFLKTIDGGKTWSVPDSILPSNGYSIFFFSETEGFIGGNYSWWAYTDNGGLSFQTSNSNSLPCSGIAFADRTHGVVVGGEGYANGFIKYTSDGGATWAETSYPQTLRAVSYASDNVVYVSGYGVLYKSTDGAQTFQPTYARGDFFVALDFPSVNVGYIAGYQGLILKTEDGGASFKKVMAGNAPFSKREHFEAIKFWDENTGYVCGDNGIMYKTENGGDSWKAVNKFTSVNLRSIHLFSATSGIVVGNEGKVFLFRE